MAKIGTSGGVVCDPLGKRGMQKVGYSLKLEGGIDGGNEWSPGADGFEGRWRRNGLPFRFLTKNSQRTRRDVALKLCRLGLEAEADDVFTCAMATARFLAKQ